MHCVLVDERPVISDNASAGNTSETDNNEIKAWSDKRQMKTIARRARRKIVRPILLKKRNIRDMIRTLEPSKKEQNIK